VKISKPNFWKQKNLIVILLLPFTLITKLIIFLKKQQEPYKPKVKTICVGNIYLGGTGKTELVIKINNIIKNKFKPLVIKKFYKNQIDEQLLLKKKTNLILPKNRVNALIQLDKSKKKVAIFDDGLQDKSIKYNLSIVCFNSFSSIGNGYLLPAGPLRETLSELIKYDAVVINGKKNKNLINKIKSYKPKIPIFKSSYILKNKNKINKKFKYLAFCGIGTPENFFDLLKRNKINVVKKIIYPDHYKYNISDINNLKEIAFNNNLKIITTEKDYVKINLFRNIKVEFAKIELHIEEFSKFKKLILKNL